MNVKEMRDFTGLTQKKFAKRFGIPIGTIRRWEYNESTPPAYVLKMMAEQLPVNKESLKKIQSAQASYYVDFDNKTIIDVSGIRIKVNEDLKGVKEHNLALYADTLFEAYYEAIDRFDQDCKLDKLEDIIWV